MAEKTEIDKCTIGKVIDGAKDICEIDFNQLESDGVITRVTGGYLVNQLDKLPHPARKLIKSISQTKNGMLIVFSKLPKNGLRLTK